MLTYRFLRYSAIDMSTFEALKLAYLRSTGKDEPGVLALLAFGSVSGSVGATMVYPLNLVRTRLQASGSSGHPERYSGIVDVVRKTYVRDGWRGFYRGLVPTLAKVRPPSTLDLFFVTHHFHNVGHSFCFHFLYGVRTEQTKVSSSLRVLLRTVLTHAAGWVYSQIAKITLHRPILEPLRSYLPYHHTNIIYMITFHH